MIELTDPKIQKYLTPYRYEKPVLHGSGMLGAFDEKAVDIPFVFWHQNKYYMLYTGFDGKGYQSALATSDDLLHWEHKGVILKRNLDSDRWDRIGGAATWMIKESDDFNQIPKLGKVAYEQCAGFIRIPDGKNPLENTAVHPESYEQTEKLLELLGFKIADLKNKDNLNSLRENLKSVNVEETAKKLEIGEMTLADIISELSKPGRDPREDMPKPVLRSDVLKFEDLTEGMVLTGTVRNVIDFGAFVDIGVKYDGLVHISEMSDSYVKSPSEIVSVGDIVKVKVIKIDQERKKVGLSMKI